MNGEKQSHFHPGQTANNRDTQFFQPVRPIQTVSFPLHSRTLAEYRGWPDLKRQLAALGCQGLEGIWSGEELEAPAGLVIGYHLTFHTEWMSLDRRQLLAEYRADLARAQRLGARYVVFHVSNASLEETYTYRWRHSSRQVIDQALELINRLLEGQRPGFAFLVENLWWPGFSFRDPAETARLLEGIRYPNKGIMLDIGHLMNTNPALRTQVEGAAFLHRVLDEQREFIPFIQGVHLHQSLSGAYAAAHIGFLPPGFQQLPGPRQLWVNYEHIQRLDQHRPWTDPAILPVLERIGPAYLTHELRAFSRGERFRSVKIQRDLLEKGGVRHG